jgi:hypothetical protein
MELKIGETPPNAPDGRNRVVAVVALFWRPFRQTAPGCLILQSRESKSILDKLLVLFIIGGIVVLEIC